eukprot:Partr_v1_DN28293_c0_g1_i4_m75172 putative TBC1 domain family member
MPHSSYPSLISANDRMREIHTELVDGLSRPFFAIKQSLADIRRARSSSAGHSLLCNETEHGPVFYTPLFSASHAFNPRIKTNNKKHRPLTAGRLHLISAPADFRHISHVDSASAPAAPPSSSAVLARWHGLIRNSKEVRSLRNKPWRDGIPWELRWLVWADVVGNPLHVTPELYSIMRQRALGIASSNVAPDVMPSSRISLATGDRISGLSGEYEYHTPPESPTPQLHEASKTFGQESSMSLISLDIPRTSALNGAPARQTDKILEQVLEAYVCYRPDVGYVQGMSYVASILHHAFCQSSDTFAKQDGFGLFVCLCNILHQPMLRTFYSMNVDLVRPFVDIHRRQVQLLVPNVHRHFVKIELDAEVYIYEWILTCYVHMFAEPLVMMIWDRFLCEGEHLLLATAVGILQLLEPAIVRRPFDEVAHMLTRGQQTIGKIIVDGKVLSQTIDGVMSKLSSMPK